MRLSFALPLVLLACGSPASRVGDDDTGSDAPTTTPPDAAPDAPPGVWTTEPMCPDTLDAIYVTPAQLPAPRGSIVKCSLGDLLTQADAQAAAPTGITAQTGVRIVKLAYKTVRSNGSVAVTTATAYLPVVPRAIPAPVVLIGRSTAGLADSCAPSKEAHPQANLALPFASHGFVTITPDFAGLGNEGTHSYLDNHEAAAELFDGALALQALEPAGLVGDPVAAVGFSQGGGVVLTAQALEHAITGKRTLKGVAAFAPEWPISTRSFSYEDILRNPTQVTALAGLAPPTVAVLRHYGFLINRMAMNGDEAFPAAQRASITGSIESLCTVALGGALDAQQVHLGDLVDDTFRLQVLACIDGTPGCTGLGQSFHQWLVSDFVTADPAGARVLIAQGLADQVMPAAGEAACDVDKLRFEGAAPDLCTDLFATHESVVDTKIVEVAAWVEALATGAPAPSCSQQFLPACDR